nr:helix-turn-helix transcriptional regulator [Micromonospora sp. DSM 115978]
MSDNELGSFLRTRREAVMPAQVGLPSNGRRRTPGLRRAELATLAGVSVDYLTRLEQGRDRHPSPQVLAALADALRLPTEERVHLRMMSKSADGGLPCMAAEPPARSVRPTVRALLGQLEPGPALLLNRLGEILAHTSGYARLAGPLGVLDTDPPSLVRYAFTDPRARRAYPDWDELADRLVADLRLPGRGDPHLHQLIDELTVTAGAHFTNRFHGPPQVPRRTGVERMVHPEAGELRLAYEILDLPDHDDQRLLVHLPADDATATALDGLIG